MWHGNYSQNLILQLSKFCKIRENKVMWKFPNIQYLCWKRWLRFKLIPAPSGKKSYKWFGEEDLIGPPDSSLTELQAVRDYLDTDKLRLLNVACECRASVSLAGQTLFRRRKGLVTCLKHQAVPGAEILARQSNLNHYSLNGRYVLPVCLVRKSLLAMSIESLKAELMSGCMSLLLILYLWTLYSLKMLFSKRG